MPVAPGHEYDPFQNLTPSLLQHVRFLFERALAQQSANPLFKDRLNRHTELAVPAYICAAAAMEVFVNELFLSKAASFSFPHAPIGVLDEEGLDEIEFMRFPSTLSLAPYLVVGKRLETGNQSYDNGITLYKLRNHLVHYRFTQADAKIMKIVENLAQQRIAQPRGGPYTWIQRISTLKGIIWAHNSALEIIRRLCELLPPDHQRNEPIVTTPDLGEQMIEADFKKRNIPLA
jgi:hypothetical protein